MNSPARGKLKLEDLDLQTAPVKVDRDFHRQKPAFGMRIKSGFLRVLRAFAVDPAVLAVREALLYCGRPRHQCAEVVKLADTPS